MDKQPLDKRTQKKQRKLGLEYFHRYGREDVLFADYSERYPHYDYEDAAKSWHTTAEKLKAAYEQGKQEAEQEKQQNPTLFYLNSLLTMMEAAAGYDEWYGNDFIEPIWVIEQAIKQIEKHPPS
jgi:hypothetical protein